MESIFGLPVHPLFVHAPAVLMPLATLATLVLAFLVWNDILTIWLLG